CLAGELERELAAYRGRVVAFEPDGEAFTQYFFVGDEDFEAAGLMPEVAQAIERRLHQPAGECQTCGQPARWLWFSREQVPSLDEVGRIAMARGEEFCARHGGEKLSQAFAAVADANLFYVNAPYGESGAYVWI